MNPLLLIDGYKLDHRRQYPAQTERVYSNLTARTSRVAGQVALDRLCGKLNYTGIGFELLPTKFTLTQLQRVHEAILGEPLDKRNFRKKIDALEVLRPLKETTQEGAGRPAQLFTLRRRGSHTPD